MTQLDLYAQPQGSASPFDAIKHVDEDGAEWWSARELMPLLGYSRWESFAEAITRASIAARNAGASEDHFRGVPKVIEGGRWGTQSVQDFRLTRYGAYLLAMNGDPRKPEIAAAQTYFAVQTRRAEVAHELDELEVARRYVKAIEDKRAALARAEAAETRVAALEPAAQAWDTLASADGDWSIGDAAKILSRDPNIRVGQGRLFAYLHEIGWTYRQRGDRRWRAYQEQIDGGRLMPLPSSHYHPRTGELVLDPPQLRVTAKGLLELHRRLGGSEPLRADP